MKRHLRAQNTSEKVDAAQVQLAFSQLAGVVLPAALAEKIADDENAESAEERETKRGGRTPQGRNPLPEHLPKERIELHPPEELCGCACCGAAMHVIGEGTSERLDYRPSSLVRGEVARMKYACACEQGDCSCCSPR